MPLYFFDTMDGDARVRDEDGYDLLDLLDLLDLRAARRLALQALMGIAGDRVPSGDRRSCSVGVRDAAGREVYQAKVELTGKWMV